MQAHLRNIEVECWEHPERLGRARPSLCLFQGAAGLCKPLLQALNELEAAGPSARRMVTFKRASRARSCSAMRLILSPERDSLRGMHVGREDAVAKIELTPTGLEQLRDAMTSWANGAEDFGIWPGDVRQRERGAEDLTSAELWFWGPRYSGP